jgi:tetratricopeptide (TPR) repeat protein
MSLHFRIFALCVTAGLLTAAAAQQPVTDWQADVRALWTAGNTEAVLAAATRRIEQAPNDLEALGWRARALARLGRTAEAEADYRRWLAATPNDADALAELAAVLSREQHFEEALTLLDRAAQIPPPRADVQVARGRVLRALGRRVEARAAFREAQRVEPGNTEAKEGVDGLAEEPRHEFRLGTDIDGYNYTDTAGDFAASLRSNWHPRWTTNLATTYYDRFGGQAVRFSGAATFKPAPRNAVTVGGAISHDDDVIAKSEAFFELDHGFAFGGKPFVRGLEINYNQRWLWFRTARVLTLTPSVLVYFPRNWIWSIGVTSARSSFPGLAPSWQPSGITRLAFPLVRRLGGNVFFAVGGEDFARTDQIGRFAARTWGGGLRWDVTRRQDLSGYVFSQDRSQRRSQTSAGLSYGFRF